MSSGSAPAGASTASAPLTHSAAAQTGCLPRRIRPVQILLMVPIAYRRRAAGGIAPIVAPDVAPKVFPPRPLSTMSAKEAPP